MKTMRVDVKTNINIESIERHAVMDPKILSKVDMTEAYKAIGLGSVMKNTFCPTILLSGIPMPLVACSDEDGHHVLIADLQLSDEERAEEMIEWLADGGADDFERVACEAKGNDMSVLYYFIAAVATSLKVRCPLVIDRDEVVKGKNIALKSEQGSDGKVGYIVLWSGWACDMMRTFYYIVKEMRHVWQVEKHVEKYFRNHKREVDCKDETEYFLQEVEVDAAAYGYRLLKDTFNWDAFEAGVILNNPAFQKAVKERADKMFLNYSEELIFMKEHIKIGE